MTAPLDLIDLFGELWCVTVTEQPLPQALQRMGVTHPEAARLDDIPDDPGEDAVMLLGKTVAPGWTMILELDGTTGFVGMDPDVLTALGGSGSTTCTIHSNANQREIAIVYGGVYQLRFEPIEGSTRRGVAGSRLAALLTDAGFPDETDPQGPAASMNSTQRCAHALHAITGITLTTDLFDDPWTGGLASLHPTNY